MAESLMGVLWQDSNAYNTQKHQNTTVLFLTGQTLRVYTSD